MRENRYDLLCTIINSNRCIINWHWHVYPSKSFDAVLFSYIRIFLATFLFCSIWKHEICWQYKIFFRYITHNISMCICSCMCNLGIRIYYLCGKIVHIFQLCRDMLLNITLWANPAQKKSDFLYSRISRVFVKSTQNTFSFQILRSRDFSF